MTRGAAAWIGLVLYVAAYDIAAYLRSWETLSQAYARALEDHRRWPVVIIWVYLTAHLWKVIPRRYDPLRKDSPKVDWHA